MARPQLCLTLTGNSLKEDFELVEKYRNYVDMAELRVDYFDESPAEIAAFPEKAGMPCILTIRRKVDGGMWEKSEEEREALFEKIFGACLSAQVSGKKSFSFVDFETDFRNENLKKACRNLGFKIIRSMHDFEKPVTDFAAAISEMNCDENEIPKIAFMPSSLDDVTRLFVQAQELKGEHILLAMGPLGTPSRILAAKLGNFLTFTSAPDTRANVGVLGHLDPVTLNDIYRFKKITKDTKVFGITGWPLAATSSPKLHNDGYEIKNLEAVYVPVRAEKISEALHFNEAVGLTGMSVTIPHKESVMPYLAKISPEVSEIGACNTIVYRDGNWNGYNTDAPGFSKSLLEFTGLSDLKGRNVAVIGAGGAACAIIYAVKKLGAKVCIFNRTESKAKVLAEKFDCDYAGLCEESLLKLKEYADIIVQTTSKGMNSTEPASEANDPIYFYDFTGREMLFDIVYVPEVTPVMARANKAGCKVINGFDMLRYQGYEQFELFTGVAYNGTEK